MIRAISFAEILPHTDLLAEYDAECSIPAIGPINPQGQMYAQMEQSGLMVCFGAFEGDKMVGFASVLCSILPHYGVRMATMESLFVAHDYRRSGYGKQLMDTVKKFARLAECKGPFFSAKVGSQLERLLSMSKGYTKTHSIFLWTGE